MSALRPRGPQSHQPRRVLHRKCTQQDLVGQAEDGRVGAYPQRQGDDANDGEPWTLPEGPQSQLKIVEHWMSYLAPSLVQA
jgi:hypothetical protein